jgi:leader peptidase (prepilin peptidase)/N-methyltransferase
MVRFRTALMLSHDYSIAPREILLCMLAGLAGVALGGWLGGAMVGVFSGLLVGLMALVTVIDARDFLIPDVLSLPAIPAGLASGLVLGGAAAFWDQLLAAAVAGGVLFILRAVYQRFRGIEGLGLGDVKLGAAAGAWLGLQALPMTCLLACLAALTAVLVQSATGKVAVDGKMALPFGCFIAPAIAVMWFYGLAVL